MIKTVSLYSYQGQEPQELPNEITLSNGKSRTDRETFTELEIKDAGFIGPYEKPNYNPEIETQHWDFVSLSWITKPIPDEIFWNNLRDKRNFLLARSDWTQLPDVPLTNEQKLTWIEYRQALRNLPKNTKNPKNVTWPLEPN